MTNHRCEKSRKIVQTLARLLASADGKFQKEISCGKIDGFLNLENFAINFAIVLI